MKVVGSGVIIEIDESKFGKRKFHRGKRVEGKWEFGGVERETGACFMKVVDDRTTNSVLSVINEYECPKYAKDIHLVHRNRTIDGSEWRCRVQAKKNPHFVWRSVRRGTWFSESKLSISIILRLTSYWFGKSMNEFLVNDLNINKATVLDWYMFCCEVCMIACVNESAKLGGEGVIVEIDESLLGKLEEEKSEMKLSIWWNSESRKNVSSVWWPIERKRNYLQYFGNSNSSDNSARLIGKPSRADINFGKLKEARIILEAIWRRRHLALLFSNIRKFL
ncbi:uncharacterized protein TNCT_632041 [Trichonephila clavata]|uniref:Uncharacterized protein n=1 Tax=Trichonephila clavata TaxID=2740835 RepID=A0A8X6LGG5_TRICU|nr:uncharacterized protein TNCT_632041 [Trichonephila clavata]